MANKIDEIRKRLKDATPGPWEYVPADDCDDWQLYNGEFTFIKQDDSGVPVSTEDGEFIANAPTDIDFLLGEVSRLKAELERAKGEIATLEWHNKNIEGCGKIVVKECEELKLLAVSATDLLRNYSAFRAGNYCDDWEKEVRIYLGEIDGTTNS